MASKQEGPAIAEPFLSMAERVGFEPTVPRGTRALQARAFGRTMLPLQVRGIIPQTNPLFKLGGLKRGLSRSLHNCARGVILVYGRRFLQSLSGQRGNEWT